MCDEKYEELVQSVMNELECSRSEAQSFIESSGMFSILD